MVHGDHNKNRSGGFFLIILGALIFITSPLYLADSPTLGGAAIVFGFIVGWTWVLHELFIRALGNSQCKCFNVDMR